MSFVHRALGAGTVASLALTAAVVVPLGGTPAAAAADEPGHGHVADRYSLELLAPTNGGVVSSALGVNDLGDVVGITRPTSSAQPQRTVLWERHGHHFHAHELANLEGSQFSRGFDLTDTQQIVGEAFNAGGGSIPVRWDGDSAPQHVTTLNAAGTGILNDIADDGVAVGTASGAGVRVAPDGAVTVLSPPVTGIEGATVRGHSATAVAEGDVIGGRATVAVPHGDHTHDELRGVVWEDGIGRLLSLPEGATSPVVAHVTPDAEAVGSVTTGGKEKAVVWAPSGTAEVLPLPGIADYTHASAKAALDGVVVGSTTAFAGNPSFGGAAVAWDAHGPVDLASRVVDLPAGVELLAANDINESGQIVGSARTADGGRGFVLTPVESSTPTLSIDGLGRHYHSGSPIELTAVTTPEDADPATYRWSVKRVDQSGFVVDAAQTTATFAMTAEQALHGAEVKVERIEDGQVVLSSPPVVLDVDDHGQAAPQVVSISGATEVEAGSVIDLTASVAPATVVDDFQWYVTPKGASAPEAVEGARGPSYAFTGTAAHDGASVTVAVTGEDGTVLYGPSAPVVLVVRPRAATPSPVPTPTPTPAPAPAPAPAPGPVVKAEPRVKVKVPATVRRGAKVAVRVVVRARGEEPTGRLRVVVAGAVRTVRLDDSGRATVEVRVPRSTRPGRKKVVVTYLGDDAVARDQQRTTVRVTR